MLIMILTCPLGQYQLLIQANKGNTMTKNVDCNVINTSKATITIVTVIIATAISQTIQCYMLQLN